MPRLSPRAAVAAFIVLVGCSSPPKTLADLGMPIKKQQPTKISIQMSLEEKLAAIERIKNDARYRFKLGKGDVISVSVYGEPDLTVEALPVRPDGKISYPLVGDIQAEGLTVDELKHELAKRLKDYVRGPKVSVIVKQFNSLEYTIAGEVVHPGPYPLVTNVTLTKAVAKAGGLTKGQFHATSVEIADLTHAFIARKGKVLPVDFARLFRDGDMRFNIPLQPGDYIFIPSGLSKEIYILGEVNRADLFAYREGLTLSHALAMATGFTPDADISNIHVVRGPLSNPQLFVVDMEGVLKGKAQDMTLRAGDIVYVPPTGLTSWSRILQKLLPGVQSIQTGVLLRKSGVF